MTKKIELRVISAEQRVAGVTATATPQLRFERLMARNARGKLDADSCTDEELWWIATGRCEPMPADPAVCDRILRQVVAGA